MPDGASTATHAKETAHKQQPALPVVRGPEALIEQLPLLTPSAQRAVLDPGRARPADILALQRVAGNRAVSRLIQTRLTVGAVGDRYEQEAGRVAEQVANGQRSAVSGQAGVQRQEEEEEVQTKPLAPRKEEEETIQTSRAAAAGDFEASSEFESQLSATRGEGHPLPANVRGQMEAGFGADLSDVRVHTGSQAAQLNRQVSARAFTHGKDIYLGAGQPDFASQEGKRLLAHELTHTIQQTGGRARRQEEEEQKVQMQPVGRLEVSATPQGEIRRTPAVFGEASKKIVKLKAGRKLRGKSAWKCILTGIGTYSKLADDDLTGRDRTLGELENNMVAWHESWQKRRKKLFYSKKKSDNKKAEALRELGKLMGVERREVLEAGKGGLTVPTSKTVEDVAEPGLTTKAKAGLLMLQKGQDILVYEDAQLQKQKSTDGTVILVVDGNRAYFPVVCHILKESGSALLIQYPTEMSRGGQETWKTGWVDKAKVTITGTEGVSQPREDIQYSAQTNAPLFPRTPSTQDVEQGGLGDCYLIAALLSIVSDNPNNIKNMMVDNLDGTVTVHLYDVARPKDQAKTFTDRYIKIDKSTAIWKDTKRDVYARGALWVKLLEKAYAAAGYTGGESATRTPSFGAIAGGQSWIAWEHLTGKEAKREEMSTSVSTEETKYLPKISGSVIKPPWDDKRYNKTYPQEKKWVDRGRMTADRAFLNYSSYHILGKRLDYLDKWMAYLRTVDVEKEVKAIAAKGPGKYAPFAEIRLNDFETLFNTRHPLDGSVAQVIVKWLADNQLYPGRRGSGKYTKKQLAFFTSIETALTNHRHVALGTKETVGRVTQGTGHSAGESKSKGLVGGHAYAVLNYGYGPGKVRDSSAGEVRWVKVRNPWGHYGRVYEQDKAKPSEEIAEFWLDLSEVTKRFESLYVVK
jgi:hypothetical protein